MKQYEISELRQKRCSKITITCETILIGFLQHRQCMFLNKGLHLEY